MAENKVLGDSKRAIDLSDEIQLIDTDKLYLYHNNPKEHPAEQIDKIASSIKHYGFIQPLVIDSDNEVIIGHGRLKASRKLGLKKVPVLVKQDLTEDEIKALRLADNKIAESGWDYEALSVELETIDYAGLEVGFEEAEIKDIFNRFEVPSKDDWADQFESKNDTSSVDNTSQITFVLPNDEMEKLNNKLAEYEDKDKNMAMILWLNES